MRLRSELRYSWGAGSNLRDSKGTQDITSIRVQATSKTFSICEVVLADWTMEWESGSGTERAAYEADAVDFHRLFRKLACDLYEIFSDFNGKSERH